MKFMKHLILIGLLSLGFAAQAAEQTATVTISSGAVSNLVAALPSGAVQISRITLLSTTTSAGRVLIYDSPTNQFTYTNASYTIPVSYVTNYISTYTNYYGRTNSLTNVALIDTTATVAASTNLYPLRFTGQAGTNSSATFDGAWVFNRGVWATNATVGSGAGGAVTVNITYQQ